MKGPGKYDDECTTVRARTKARGVILIVFDGEQGTGFSCQADLELTKRIPDILDMVSAEIRADHPE